MGDDGAVPAGVALDQVEEPDGAAALLLARKRSCILTSAQE
jgi:hypothetical protein